MEIGLIYPQTELGDDPAAISDYAQTAEGLGFAHILAYDHILGASLDHPNAARMPYTIEHPFLEPLSLFAFMAGITRRIGFATGVIILPQRQTPLFAKQAATLDILCQGRLRLGIGLGWNEVEYIAQNESFHNRGRRIEEQVEVLRLLWTRPLVSFQGKWHNIPNAGLNPLPVQRPIPLWFGGTAEPAIRRAARLGDGWMLSLRDPLKIQPALDVVWRTLDEANRPRAEFGLDARVYYGDGQPRLWAEQVEAWRSAGVTHLSFNTMGAGLETPGDHLQAVRLFAEVTGTAPP